MSVSILGQNIQRIRIEQGINAYALSKKARVSASTISEIENGTRQSLNSSTVTKIADALGVTFDSLYATQNDIEYVVNDIFDAIDVITDSDELSFDNIKMSENEKAQLKVGVKAIIDILRINRNDLKTKGRDNK